MNSAINDVVFRLLRPQEELLTFLVVFYRQLKLVSQSSFHEEQFHQGFNKKFTSRYSQLTKASLSVHIQVCRELHEGVPPLDEERGERLLSPMVMCGPHGLRFNHPVELRLPHCASMTPDGWSFALKSSDNDNAANQVF